MIAHIDREAFVGTAMLSATELQDFLETWSECHWFQRWPHCVRWEAPDWEALSPIGQVFNRDRELRWKQRGDRFDVLLLSRIALPPEFEAIGQGWRYRDRSAHFYPKTDTRLPRSLSYPDINIAQRYFMDAQTAVVQFVALTLS